MSDSELYLTILLVAVMVIAIYAIAVQTVANTKLQKKYNSSEADFANYDKLKKDYERTLNKIELLEQEKTELKQCCNKLEDKSNNIMDELAEAKLNSKKLYENLIILNNFKNTVKTHIPDWKEQIEENSVDNINNTFTYSNRINVDSNVLGEDFERFVGWTFKNKGWNVTYNGIENGVNDLGRDLIATMGNRVCIIQCKNWDCFHRTIRENVICQLYGTAMAYKAEHPRLDIIPVLATTTKLSPKAKLMAQLLKIKIGYYKIRVNGEQTIPYPQIKCNINSENRKIYHEPDCPCYYRTKILKNGEFYTPKISEAIQMGFHPCHRH